MMPKRRQEKDNHQTKRKRSDSDDKWLSLI
jgi:hypothetical protein